MSIPTVNVRQGFWINHEAGFFNRYCYLCSDACVNRLSNAVAILIALTLARLIVVLTKTIKWTIPDTPQPQAGQNIPLNTRPAPATTPHHQYHEVHAVLEESRSSFGAAWRTLNAVFRTIFNVPIALTQPSRRLYLRLFDKLKLYWRNIKEEWRLILCLVFTFILCGTIFTLEGAASIFNADLITTDDLAISQAEGCGMYRAPLVPEVANVSRNVQLETDAEIAAYVAACYDSPEGTDGCGFFVKQRLPFRELNDQPCPFGAEICPEEANASYTLETDLIPLTDIGLNVRENYGIKKKTTCTPLNMNESFVHTFTDSGNTFHGYYYGSYKDWKWDTPYTWNNSISSPTTTNAGYEAVTFRAGTSFKDKVWTPHPALEPPPNHAVTLFLLGSRNVLHLRPRPQDPIFLTNSERVLYYDNRALMTYTYNSSALRAFACLESSLICNPNGTLCQAPGTKWSLEWQPRTHSGQQAVYLATIALLDTSIWTALRGRLGAGLVASTKLSQAISLPLAEQQWKVEARQFFQVSLAGQQIVLRDMMRAKWFNVTGLVNWFDRLDEEHRKGLCGLYVFHANGFRNFTIVGLVVSGSLVALVQLAAFEIDGQIRPLRWVWRQLKRIGRVAEMIAKSVGRGATVVINTVRSWFH